MSSHCLAHRQQREQCPSWTPGVLFSTAAREPLQCCHVCVCVCRWDSPDLLASSATAAPAIQLKSGEGGRHARLEREKRQKEGGERVQAQIKTWGPGLGWVPLCYKNAGLLETRVWWLGLGTSDHHSCCSLPRGSYVCILTIIVLVIISGGIQDASSGRRPQAGL